jgi:hypothetical protein
LVDQLAVYIYTAGREACNIEKKSNIKRKKVQSVRYHTLHVIDLWANSNNWYQSEVEDLKLRLPRGGDY